MQLVLGLSDSSLWLEYFRRLPPAQQEVFCRPEYYRIFGKPDMGTATCFIYEEGENFIMYPFFRNKVRINFDTGAETGTAFKENHRSGTKAAGGISVQPDQGSPESNTHYHDIQGAYGYNGVFSNSEDPALIRSFHDSFLTYCKDSDIIAEFVRFNPVSKNHRFSEYLDIIHANNNVIVDLFSQDIWRGSYEYSTRKNINKAQRSGLVSKIFTGAEINEEWIGIFHDIYKSTMMRNSAEDFYFFDAALFRELAFELPDNTLFFFILNDRSLPVSAELILYNEFTGYSFLGGTLSEFYQYRPNDLIKHTIIETLKSNGLRYFCLGGGIEPDDGIFRFKRSFSKNGTVKFYIGKKVHNREIYDRVVERWELNNPGKIENYRDFLLKYKY